MSRSQQKETDKWKAKEKRREENRKVKDTTLSDPVANVENSLHRRSRLLSSIRQGMSLQSSHPAMFCKLFLPRANNADLHNASDNHPSRNREDQGIIQKGHPCLNSKDRQGIKEAEYRSVQSTTLRALVRARLLPHSELDIIASCHHLSVTGNL